MSLWNLYIQDGMKKNPTSLLSILITTHLPALKGSLFSQMKSVNLKCLSRICSEALFLKHSLGLPRSSVGIFEPTLQKRLPHIPHFGPWTFPEVWGQRERPDRLSALDLLRIYGIAAIFPRPEIKPPGLKWLRLMRRINTPDETSYSLRCVLILCILCLTDRYARLHVKVQMRDFLAPSGDLAHCRGWIPVLNSPIKSVETSLMAISGKVDLLGSRKDHLMQKHSQKLQFTFVKGLQVTLEPL